MSCEVTAYCDVCPCAAVFAVTAPSERTTLHPLPAAGDSRVRIVSGLARVGVSPKPCRPGARRFNDGDPTVPCTSGYHCGGDGARPDRWNPIASQCRTADPAGQFCPCHRVVQSAAGRRSRLADLSGGRTVAGRQRPAPRRGESGSVVEQGARRSADAADVCHAPLASIRPASRGVGPRDFCAFSKPALRAVRVINP